MQDLQIFIFESVIFQFEKNLLHYDVIEAYKV